MKRHFFVLFIFGSFFLANFLSAQNLSERFLERLEDGKNLINPEENNPESGTLVYRLIAFHRDKWYPDFPDWSEADTITYAYNDQNLLAEDARYVWDFNINGYKPFWKSQYIYNDLNQLTTAFHFWGVDTNWTDYRRVTYTYDSNGNEISRLVENWSASDANWKNASLYARVFNSDDQLLLEISQNWEDDTWKNGSQFSGSYENGRLIEGLHQFWDDGISNWKNTTLSNHEYEYFQNGTTLKKQTDYFYKWEDEDWVLRSRSIDEFDMDEKYIIGISQTWDADSEEWINKYRTDNEYDQDGNILQELDQSWDLQAEEWYSTSRLTWTHTDFNMPETFLSEYRDTADLKWEAFTRDFYYYESVVPVQEIIEAPFTVQIYPNPSDGLLSLEFDQMQEANAKLTVYNSHGQLIHEQGLTTANSQTIDLSEFEEGLFSLQIVCGNTVVVRKVLIMK